MKYSYFPGCTLKSKATELDKYARDCAAVLGFEMEEIENWQCCGGVYPMARVLLLMQRHMAGSCSPSALPATM